MESNSPIIVWFRQDLRISDNCTLHNACKTGKPLIMVYIHDSSLGGEWNMGSASRWWLHKSLEALSADLHLYKTPLILRQGNTLEELGKLIHETQAQGLFFSRHYEPYNIQLETDIHTRFSHNIEVKRFKNNCLVEPEKILNKSGEPFKVFTPFYKCAMRELNPPAPIPAPDSLNNYSQAIPCDELTDWGLLPDEKLWGKEFKNNWQPGEEGAHINFDAFNMHALSKYNVLRNRPEFIGTSRLSPHLHFGEIGPRQLWHRVMHSDQAINPGSESFIRELMWREFSYYLLHYWPQLPHESFKPNFNEFPWINDMEMLTAWQQGKTGYPIVDAGMRELWETGWMHNRVRMIVASFLIKHLLIDWRYGEQWFWDTLVDADLANNSASWQWVAGCGADAAPYFRIFNPQLQGEKFDPDGVYVKQWLPELKHLPKKFIHSPWDAPELVLKESSIELGNDYPHPIVDHIAARDRALSAFEDIKVKTGTDN